MNRYASNSAVDEKFAKRLRWKRKRGLLRHGKQSRRDNRPASFRSQSRGFQEEER